MKPDDLADLDALLLDAASYSASVGE